MECQLEPTTNIMVSFLVVLVVEDGACKLGSLDCPRFRLLECCFKKWIRHLTLIQCSIPSINQRVIVLVGKKDRTL